VVEIRRRQFITLLGGAVAAWPLTAGAQQAERIRRIGVLMSTGADDPEGQARIAAFRTGLHQLGWAEGRNVQINARWPTGGAEARKYAADLVALAPDVILATGVYAGSLLEATPNCADCVRAGRRPSRCGLCREPSAAGRQRYRFFLL
jgi:putative ABC transport system substrate-binding protein